MIGDLLKQQFGVEAVTLWLLSWFVDMTGCTIGLFANLRVLVQVVANV